MEIDLSSFASTDTIVLSGRPKGREIRKKLRLDEQDQSAELVDVKIPFSILTVNSSFFLGLFGESVRKLGAGGFRNKYRFSANDIVMNRDIVRGITYAQEHSNPLS